MKKNTLTVGDIGNLIGDGNGNVSLIKLARFLQETIQELS